jgi:DNA-binding beta-propeller fold protein YncE
VINTATNTVDQTLAAGTSPYGIAISANGEYAYVTNLAYTATDSPVVNWIGKVSVVSLISTGTNKATSSSIFPIQSLTIILLVAIIIVLSAVIIAKRKMREKNRHQTSAEAEQIKQNPIQFRIF